MSTNDNILKFINGIGSITEVWTIVYKSFIVQGYSNESALEHTKALIEVMCKAILGNVPGGK